MKRPLTYRQQQFLGLFLDIYREIQYPVHYAAVAERLGIGKVTAYEMLRLLEERGFVRAEYQPNPEQHGPGRSAVLFYPTTEGDRLIKSLVPDPASQEDWQTVKEQILNRLHQGNAGGYEELLSTLLMRLPERHSPLIFMTELITAVILTLASIQEAPEVRAVMNQLKRIGLPHEVGLSVLSGISMILSVLERTNRFSANVLLTQINRYEDILLSLTEESKRQLSEFAREVVRLLSS